jgi:adenine phosphoribosyltransferase
MGDLSSDVRAAIRDIPDFPKPGILFKDITTVISTPELFRRITEWMAVEYANVDVVIGIESRGFIFGAPMAIQNNTSFQLARKAGKLPHSTISESYDLEYGQATLELHTDAVKPGQRVVIVDDLLATGGTCEAAIKLVQRLGGEVIGCIFLLELGFLEPRARLHPVPVTSLVTY